MPRLRNAAGVTISVSDETAARIGPEWRPVDGPKEPTPPATPEPRPEPVSPEREGKAPAPVKRAAKRTRRKPAAPRDGGGDGA